MADYKRMVSYIYSYDNGVKMNNVGFAKLEERNEQLKITVNIKNVHINNSSDYKVYIFERGEAEELKGVLLGNLIVKNGAGEFRSTANSDNIMNSATSFRNCVGLIIENNSEKSYATGWDDKPIKISKLRIDVKKETDETINSTREISTDNKEVIKEAFTEILNEEKNIDTIDYVPNSTNIEPDINDTSKIETAIEYNQLPNETSYNIHNKQQLHETEIINPHTEILDEAIDIYPFENPSTDYKMNPYIMPQNNIETSSINNINDKNNVNIIENNSESFDNSNELKFNNNDFIENELLNNYPKLHPFEDKEIFDCIRIEPQDIGLLPMETWILGNNSFLLHGYYNYKHLLLGKVKADDTSVSGRGFRYILGVPGINQTREKFLAKMFGFEHFKITNLKEQKSGEFGYWYMFINL